MHITPISADSWQLTRYGFINCYLVRETDGFTLIDTTLPGAATGILAAAESLGAPIRRILLTHAHIDHVGSADALVAKLPGVALAASERTLPLLQRPVDKSFRIGEPRNSFTGGLPGIAAVVTQIVDDDELVGSLRCVATPGHLPGHFSFLDERDGTLFTGDALVAVGRLSVSGWTPWYFPLPGFVMWSKPLAIASARRLLDYPIERFACGHGPVRGGGIRALRHAMVVAEMSRVG
jgi:glyoxylase-like metal-dependent hydrolase (beta-lactamase superfamily II)